MPALYTVDSLLINAKLRAFLPSSNTSTTSLTDSDILILANDELWGALTPKIQKAVQEYFVQEYIFPLVPGQDVYDLPARATGGALRDVYLLTSADTYVRQKLARISPEQIQSGSATASQPLQGPSSFWLQANQLLLYPHVTQSWTLVLSCLFRPNIMTPLVPATGTTNCATIASFVESTGVVTLTAAAPSTFLPNINYDIIRAVPGFDTLGFDFTASAVAGANITFNATAMTAIGGRLNVGDYVCLAQQSCVPQIPQTLHPLLAARVGLRILRAIGDKENAAVLAQDVADMEESMYQMLVTRVEGKTDTLMPNELMGYTRPKWFTSSM